MSDDRHPLFDGIPASLFRRQMEMLKRHFLVRPLTELVRLAESGTLPPNGIAITFDDGYRDNYTHAFPILAELELPATIFLVTDAVDENRFIWHDRLIDALYRTRIPELAFEGGRLPLVSVEDKKRALFALLGVLRRSSPAERDSLVDDLVAELAVQAPESGTWDKLGWDDVREMSRRGVDFGAHTLDHPILSRVSSDEARRQIRGSKERIEAELGTPVTLFAYPNGRASDFDASTRRILAEEGFRCAVTTEPGANDGKTDPFMLRRVAMRSDEEPGISVMRLAWSRRS